MLSSTGYTYWSEVKILKVKYSESRIIRLIAYFDFLRRKGGGGEKERDSIFTVPADLGDNDTILSII